MAQRNLRLGKDMNIDRQRQHWVNLFSIVHGYLMGCLLPDGPLEWCRLQVFVFKHFLSDLVSMVSGVRSCPFQEMRRNLFSEDRELTRELMGIVGEQENGRNIVIE